MKRSIQLLNLAVHTAYQAYTPFQAVVRRVDADKRADERRPAQRAVAFPDRRIGERRGRSRRAVAQFC
ncbi:MAG: hypothetical protein ACREVF_03295 [Burkholderiales bacterium]